MLISTKCYLNISKIYPQCNIVADQSEMLQLQKEYNEIQRTIAAALTMRVENEAES